MRLDVSLTAEEKLASLFQTDTLVPDQFYDTCHRRLYLEPEKKLMLAVLEDAVVCFRKYICARDSKGRTLHRQAEEWILDTSGGGPFSFDNVCEFLGFSPAYVRQGLLRWKESLLAEHPAIKVYAVTPTARQSSHAADLKSASQKLLKAVAR